jgi:gamma-glutamylcyclotransferase (GGCT)/AIG2-like uncharacterized protein YtfP
MYHLLFVYGTLKKGFDNHNMIAGSYFVATGRTVKRFAMYKQMVPYVTKSEAVSPIFGELYRVHGSALDILDLFEGNPVWNYREEIEVLFDQNSATVTAWMYFNDTPVGELVSSGIYTR